MMTPAEHLTAAEIRANISLLVVGDLRGVPAALATTGARTEAARADVRAAIERREAGYPVRVRAGSPAHIEAAIESFGALSTPSTRRIYTLRYRDDFARSTFAERLVAYRARLAAERLARDLAAVRGPVLAAYKRCSYRVSRSSWAGGDHTTTVRIGEPSASGTTSRAWSKNGKWSGLDSSHSLHVRASWCSIPESARVVDGLLTLDLATEIEPGIRSAIWAEQGRGVSLSTRHGYLVERAGSWSHADTLVGARRALKAAPVARPAVDLSTLDGPALLRRARCPSDAVITIDDAPVEGRVCAAGVRDWAAKRSDLDGRTSATAGEIARLAAASQDRAGLVLVVLRAAGQRARAGAQAVAA